MDEIENEATEDYPMTESKEIVQQQFRRRVIQPAVLCLSVWVWVWVCLYFFVFS
jgi:hypothetical protein